MAKDGKGIETNVPNRVKAVSGFWMVNLCVSVFMWFAIWTYDRTVK